MNGKRTVVGNITIRLAWRQGGWLVWAEDENSDTLADWRCWWTPSRDDAGEAYTEMVNEAESMQGVIA